MSANANALVKALENLILELTAAKTSAGLGSRGIFAGELEKFVNVRIAQKVNEEVDALKEANRLK